MRRTLRSLLEDDASAQAQHLAEHLRIVEERANRELFPRTVPDRGSHTGQIHCASVERVIDELLTLQPRLALSPAEAFVLLAAILLHDLGKLQRHGASQHFPDLPRFRFVASFEGAREMLAAGESGRQGGRPRRPDHHFLWSTCRFLENPADWGVFDEGLADAIGRVIALHSARMRGVAAANHWLDPLCLEQFGVIRIGWLGALLCVGDEMDTTYRRVEDPGKPKGHGRDAIRGYRLDLVGRLVVLHPKYDVLRDLLEGGAPPRDGQSLDAVRWIAGVIRSVEDVIRAWRRELKQMDLELRGCMVAVGDHLLTTVPPAGARTSERPLFQLGVEPNLTPWKVDRVLAAVLKLRLGVFGKRTFSWELLASEAGMESVAEVRGVFHRVAAVASLGKGHGFSDLVRPGIVGEDLLPTTFVELDGGWSVEYPGTGAGDEGDDATDAQAADVHRAICQRFARCFKNQRERIEGARRGGGEVGATAAGRRGSPASRLYLCTSNEELNYLLDEDMCRKVSGRGVCLPDWDVPGHTDDGGGRRHLGVNVLIAGPPGMGKSSLAFEMIAGLRRVSCYQAKGGPPGSENEARCEGPRTSDTTGVVAYVSLEQPLAAFFPQAAQIKHRITRAFVEKWERSQTLPDEVAKSLPCFELGLGDSEPRIEVRPLALSRMRPKETYDRYMDRPYRDLYEELTEDARDARVVLLPHLSPRAFPSTGTGDGSDVFWHRFKQLARLCEFGPWYARDWALDGEPTPPELLAIAVDNLNAFGQGALAREQIHQLFRLSAWAGVLGIYIWEQEPGAGPGATILDEAAFLADIVIRLSWGEGDYRHKQIEVHKSRFQRHVLGAHSFKIRDNRLHIYPSLHTLSARGHQKQKATEGRARSNDRGLFPREVGGVGTTMRDDALVLLQGRRGSFKLDLALLYARAGGNRDDKVLLLNFGPELIFEELSKARVRGEPAVPAAGLAVAPWEATEKQPEQEEKYKIKEYVASGDHDCPALLVMDFDMGYLMPEECISFILKAVDEHQPTRVVVYSVYHLPFRFPLLYRDPNFLPFLVQLMKLRAVSTLIVSPEPGDQSLGQELGPVVTGLRSSADLIVRVSKPETSPDAVEVEVEDVVVRRYKKHLLKLVFDSPPPE